MGQGKVYLFVAVIAGLAAILEAISFGLVGVSGLPSEQRTHAWVLFLLVGISGSVCGYGLLGWLRGCAGNPGEPADGVLVALAEDVVRSGEWCKVPKATDLGGMAIALTAIRQLTWRIGLIKAQMHLYLTEWERETALDIGLQNVTIMFHDLARRGLIHMQLDADSHLEGLMGKHPQIRAFREKVGHIVKGFSKDVVQPLRRALGERDATQVQTDVAEQVGKLLDSARALEDEIETWKESLHRESGGLRNKLLGRAQRGER